MKKNSTKKNEQTAAAPAPQPEAAPITTAQTESKPDLSGRSPEGTKPDFYARLMADRPTEAASIMATLCRRKDKALRVMVDAHNAGKDAAECIREAMAVAFPRKQEAAPPVACGVTP